MREHHAERPIADDAIHESIDVAAKPATLTERQIVERAEFEDVRDVSRIARVANHEDIAPESLPGVDLLVAKRVVRVELETLREPAAQLELQRVVVRLADVGRQVRAPESRSGFTTKKFAGGRRAMRVRPLTRIAVQVMSRTVNGFGLNVASGVR